MADENKSNGTNAFAAKAKDLDALRAAVIDAAGVGAGLWISYLFVLFYLLIATGSVTHRDLLFENPIKLPFLNVELPLVGFFVLGPLLFLIVHAYVLLHFVLLADKVGAFHAELESQIADEDVRTRLRRQLPSNIFVQFLAGPREVSTGIIGFILRLIAQISLVGAPLALLAFMLFQFLPYHHEVIAWWQRLALVADLGLLWMLWPGIARGEATWLTLRDFRRGNLAAAALASVAVLFLVFGTATFPGERLDQNPLTFRFIPRQAPGDGSLRLVSLHDFLLAGDVDFVARKPTSLGSNRLVLPSIDIINHEKLDTDAKIAALPESLSLRGRRLEGAVLVLANLRKVDFTGAQLQGAVLSGADLREAKFVCDRTAAGAPEVCTQLQGASLADARAQGAHFDGANLRKATLSDAQLQNATFQEAQLQEAILEFAALQRANFAKAKLQRASLRYANLERASLDEAQLEGAQLQNARLQGAVLNAAQLQNASFYAAQLHGAWLVGAQLQGANLRVARLFGASLDKAQLQGATLDGAHLEGATLTGAAFQGVRLDGTNFGGALLKGTQLHGADLRGAPIAGAVFDHVYVWRARPPRPGARVIQPETAPKYAGLECRGDCDWIKVQFDNLRQLIKDQVPSGPQRDESMQRIAMLDPTSPFEGEKEFAEAWTDLARSSDSSDAFDESVAERLRQIGCDPDANGYVINGLLRHLKDHFQDGSARLAKLAADFLDETRCRGARGLSDDDKLRLRDIRDRSREDESAGSAPRAKP